MAKHNQRGRSKSGDRHARLTHFLMDTRAWLSLSPIERALYLEVARIYNGTNNGWLGLSVRRAGVRCNINKDTAAAALKVLMERGFIELATPGGFSRKTPHAAEWRLTEWPCDRTHTPATKAYQHWRPEPVKALSIYRIWSRTSGPTAPSRFGGQAKLQARGAATNREGVA